MRARRVYKSQKQCIRMAPNHTLLLILDAHASRDAFNVNAEKCIFLLLITTHVASQIFVLS